MTDNFLKYVSFPKLSRAAAVSLLTITLAFSLPAGAETPAGKQIQKLLEKDESIGFSTVLKTRSAPAEVLAVSINREPAGAMDPEPSSKLSCFTGSALQEIDTMSVYIDSLRSIDIDGDGDEEALYTRRGGMKQILEFFILKYKGTEKGKVRFENIFSSPGVNFGQMNVMAEPGKLPQILIHTVREEKMAIDVTFFFGFDKSSSPPVFKLINTVEMPLKD